MNEYKHQMSITVDFCCYVCGTHEETQARIRYDDGGEDHIEMMKARAQQMAQYLLCKRCDRQEEPYA